MSIVRYNKTYADKLEKDEELKKSKFSSQLRVDLEDRTRQQGLGNTFDKSTSSSSSFA